MSFGRSHYRPIFFQYIKEYVQDKERTGVEHEEPMERSSIGKGTRATVMAAIDRQVRGKKNCMIVNSNAA